MFRDFSASDIIWVPLLLLAMGERNALAQSPPSGFASATVSGQWNEAVGITFNEDGTEMFVWERGGKVYVEKNNQRQLLLDISEEVGGWHDHGLIGFALHPQFSQNGYFYLLYLVDRHYLMNYGTGAYSATTNDYFSATIGRLTRYTASKNGSGYTVNSLSRKILIGETKSTGILSIARSHVTGSLVFGTDKTLLVATGDGAHGAVIDTGSASASYYEQALQDGILSPALNIGAFRSQVVNSLNGKILRIDPETGGGIPSNPFYDPSNPNGAISKVWSLGIRQPFRMSLKPGTGSHNPADANPGILYLVDVGYQSYEELNVVNKPGMNFGWPIYEGLELSGIYSTININHPFAPNPLYQVNGCTRQYFYFQDLLKPATPNGSGTFTNPCNTQQTIPTSIPTFVHSRPIIDWAHGPSGPSRTGTFNGQTPTVTNIGPGAPVTGSQFGGDCGVAGVFYTGTDFPEEYRNTFFFGDYGKGWVKNLKVNATDNPVQVGNFINSNAVVVGMATHPAREGLYYVNFPSEVRRIYYSSNRPPVAVASSDKTFGVSPLLVQFTGSNSVDPESQPLFYEWNFGDGSPLNNQANPTHTFTTPGTSPVTYNVTLKVRDNEGVEDQKTIVISNNNSPPQVQITSPIDSTLYPLSGETVYPLQATVTDQEHSGQQLSYQWQTILHHQSHVHPEPIDSGTETTTNISPLGCDGETYFYRVVLTVTDASGASTTEEVKLFPNCGEEKITPLLVWANPSAIVTGTALSATQLNATATINGVPVAGTFTYTPALGTVLPLSAGQELSVDFAPTNTDLYNLVSKTVTIDVISTPTSSFYRAININGPGLVIDGNNWTASTGAPNFSYTTNQWAISHQHIPLIPATDANRTTMIRSSVWGNVNLAMSAVPAGTYQVWLYVWEDNSPAVISISLEGIVVQANYNTGAAGTWRKLGPFQAAINDGTINVSATGAGNVSGLEVWTAGPPPPNRPPVVANALIDQNGSVGASFSYTFAANSFTDPDAGNILTYTSTLENGTLLPGWLTFTGSTRNFSGVPLAANLGSINVRVTASDGGGESVSDIFTVTVTPAVKVTPLITWANPLAIVTGTALSATQLNATATYSGTPVAGTFTYTPPLGTVLPLGAGQQLSVDFVPTNTDLYNPVSKTVAIDVISTPTSTFYRAININGPALLIDGNNWTASTGAPNFSYTTNQWAISHQHIPLIPATDANRTTMIRSSVWGNVNLAMSAVPAGTYQVWLYVWEDNSPTVISISLEGIVVQANYNTGAAGTWRKLGPFQAAINDGTINVSATGAGNVSGLEVWTAGPPPSNRPPVVANALIDQNGSVGASFSYTFAANSFTDPDAGTTLTYTSTLENGTPLPGWLSFIGSTRNFSGVPLVANLGSINVRVTASDGGGESVSDIFTLTVTPAVKVTPLITWANPLAIVTGTVLSATQLNATATYSGTPVAGTFTYTPPLGTVLPLGAGQQLSVDFAPTNTDLYNPVSKTVAIDVISTPTSTFYRAININGPSLLIDGNNWTASTGAPNFSYTTNQWAISHQHIPLIPAADANRTTMIRSSVWGNVNLAMSAVPGGTYQVWLYVWEDNSPVVISISLEGIVVQANYNTGPAGTWRKLGPFQAAINDGTINVAATGAGNVSGIEIWSMGQSLQPSGTARKAAEPSQEQWTNLTDLTVFPNPFSNRLSIAFLAKQSGAIRLEIFSLNGAMLYSLYEGSMFEGQKSEREFEMDHLSNGVYILQLLNGKHTARLKLIKVE